MYEREILELYRRCNIRSFPVDCDRILNAFGYEVVTYQESAGNDAEARRLLNTVSTDGFAIRKPKRVYVNERSYIRRQLFTKAHEIGHIAMMSDSENVANEFAANLLAPRPIIFAEKLRSSDAISKFFGISSAAANHALIRYQYIPDQASLNLVSYFGLRHSLPWPFNQASIDEMPDVMEEWDALFRPKPENTSDENGGAASQISENALRKRSERRLEEIRRNPSVIRMQNSLRRLFVQMRSSRYVSSSVMEEYERLQRELQEAERRLPV